MHEQYGVIGMTVMYISIFAVRTSKNIGIMFLNEVALGKEYTITTDDPSLRKAPNGYESVVARGTQEPGWCPFHIEVTKKINSSFR